MLVTADLANESAMPTYVRLADRAKHMRELGMSYRAIGRALGVDYKVASKAVAWMSRSEQPSR